MAELAEKKKIRSSKKNEDEILTGRNNDLCQMENLQSKPKKFLLLSDDDLSDNDGPARVFTDSNSENDRSKKSVSLRTNFENYYPISVSSILIFS